MSKITHPSMRRGRGTPAQNSPQTYIVEDASDSSTQPLVQDVGPVEQEPVTDSGFDDIDAHLQQFEAGAAPTKETTVSPGTKKTLEGLLFAGRVEKDLELAGNTYAVSTLTNKEHNEVVKEVYSLGTGADLFVIKALTLALALRSINGTPLEDIEIDGHFNSELYRKKEIIDNLQMTVVERLYEEYSTMVEESEKLLSGEELKNS